MALVESFTDDFSFLDSTKWFTEGTAAVSGGQLNLTCATTAGGVGGQTNFSLIGSSVYVALLQVPRQGSSEQNETYLKFQSAAGQVLYCYVFNNLLYFGEFNVSTDETPIAYDPVAHLYLRLRESGGSVFWDTSPDGVSWTNRRSKVTTADYTSGFVRLQSHIWGTGTSGDIAVFDNLNVVPPVYSYRATQIPNGHVGPMALRRALRGHVRFTPQSFPDPGTDYTQSAADPLGVTDSITATTDFALAASDPVGELDSTAVTQDWVRSQTDLLGTTDSATGAQGFDRTATDTAGVTDSIALTVGTAATDPVGLVDTATSDAGRSATDLEGIGDSSTVQQDWARTPTDLLGVADSLGLAATRDATDTVGLGDVGTAVQDWARTATDQIAATDSSALAQAWSRAQTDLVGVTDTTSVRSDVVRASTDTVATADALGTVVGYQRSTSDPCDLTDDATFVLAAPGEANADELVDISDTAVLAFSTTRTATDTVGVGDSASAQSTRTTADDLAVTDTTGFVAGYVRSLTDPIGVADSATFTITVAAADTATVADTVRFDRDAQLVDAADLTDAAAFSIAYAQALTDPVGVTDSATFQLGDNVRTVVDPVGVTDSVLVDIFTAPGPDNTWVVRPESVTAGLPAESTTVALSENATVAVRAEIATHAVRSETNVMEV